MLQKIHQILNPAYRKLALATVSLKQIQAQLIQLQQRCTAIVDKNETEEHLKEPIREFLQQRFGDQYLINTKGRVDMAIYLGETNDAPLGVLLEIKKPSNKSEFPTIEHINKKALHELVLYYMRERIQYKNNNIKHLVISNGLEWFFFKSDDFYTHFYKNSFFKEQYQQFESGLKDSSKTDLFYKDIAAPYIETIQSKINFFYFNLQHENIGSKISDKRLSELCKLFSPEHLLNIPFGNDANQLDKDFYNELLHIIGLEEVKNNGKKIIGRKINPDYGSLLESALFQLEDKDHLKKIKSISNESEKAFNAALNLCLTWINRILFLKLLEAQLISYHPNDAVQQYCFLNINFIKNFDDLNNLFFSALAKLPQDRHPRYQQHYQYIPYLNSSLFEKSALEQLLFSISALTEDEMPLHAHTILKTDQGKRAEGKKNTLAYLFEFLDAYDFSTQSEDPNPHNQKNLINASVLGLIFEKINGYKEGSFYTPAFITMHMCRESLRHAVVAVFKENENNEIVDFEDCIAYCQNYYKSEDKKKFNSLINKLKICDPAVGSGHFLVSALNELIVIKTELGILIDEKGRRLPCDITIINDELNITDENGEPFVYKIALSDSKNIQKTLFHEKQVLIENCLFGVDINPNSVKICRLRLWIELLKNAYYTEDNVLHTLPNIDINIKQGNSLISRFGLTDDLKSAFKSKAIEYTLNDYKKAVSDYKNTNNKDIKEKLNTMLAKIKDNLTTELYNNSPLMVRWINTQFSLKTLKQGDLFLEEQKNYLSKEDQIKNKLLQQNIKKLEKDFIKYDQQKRDIETNQCFKQAFEWRFEFPEVLDHQGNFIGFDVIIGNPPYIQMQANNDAIATQLQVMNYLSYERTGDIYAIFYEKGASLLNHHGNLNFITSNKWMKANYGKSLRGFLTQYTQPLCLIDFSGIAIFDEATVDTNILHFKLKSVQNDLSTDFKA